MNERGSVAVGIVVQDIPFFLDVEKAVFYMEKSSRIW